MGLDIKIEVDNFDDVFHDEYYTDKNIDAFHKHNLSRTFCNFICRRYVINGETELEQIGKITSVDISPIDKMETDHANLDNVLKSVSSLIEKLSQINNLPSLLNDNGQDTLDNGVYFADFQSDKGDGYIDNNFGQDLRNFKKFLEYAKSCGTTTVGFNYG